MPAIRRRHLLAAAAVAPLAACVESPAPGPSPRPPSPTAATPAPSATPTHPLGLEPNSRVEALIFDGAFGLGHARSAAEILERENPGVEVRLQATNAVAEVAGPALAGGTPPDLIDNTGAGALALADIADSLLELDDLLAAPGLDGEPIEETLYGGVVEAGTFNGRRLALNYALSVYGLWHSASLFAERGWAVPQAWDELLLLGEEARSHGQLLFTWGAGAAYYYAELAMSSAIKEGGHSLRRALDNLEPDAWAHPAVNGVLTALEECVRQGFLRQDGDYLEAQARWASAGTALFYPSGSWIAREVAASSADGFELTVSPVPTLTAAPTLPIAAVHAQPTEQFVVPKDAANPAGGMELLRVMLSQGVAAEFARTNLVPTVVRGSVPADHTSTALAAQTRMLADAGADVFSWRFVSHYGLSDDYNRLWAEFLRGELPAALLAEQLQALADAVRADPDVPKYTVE